MQQYLVTLEGSNLLIDVEGATDKFGFVRLLLVDAEDATQAAKTALHEMTSDEALQAKIKNDEGDSPAMTVKDVAVAEGDDAVELAGTTVWYPMNSRE